MRVIIAGSREFNNYKLLKKECLSIFRKFKEEGYNTSRNNIEIISGTARGADKLGEKFSKEFNLKLKKFPADWNNLNVEKCVIKTNKYGKKYNALAGHNRNLEMAKYAKEDEEIGTLIDFWNGKSYGSKHMIDLGDKYELKVFVINY